MGIEALNDMYPTDEDFKEAYKVCNQFENNFHSDYSNFILQEGLLINGSQIFIPNCSIRDNIIREKHRGGHGGYLMASDMSLEEFDVVKAIKY